MIRNFAQVQPGLFRSGKYDLAGLRELATTHGIKTVIDLRDKPPILGARTYRSAGVEFLRIPCNGLEQLPWDSIASEVDRRMHRGSVLVHCWNGTHRTGAFVGAWRVLRQGWTFEQAWKEAQAFGFGSPDAHKTLALCHFGGVPWV